MGALLLAACSSSTQPVPDRSVGSTSAGSSLAPSPGTLPIGVADSPNGPVPAIVVDQFGYRPGDAKVAVLRNPVTGYDVGGDYRPSATIDLVVVGTARVVLSREAVAWNRGREDPASGDQAWHFDFSEVQEPGRYYVRDAARGVRSATFSIAAEPHALVVRNALRTFFYQRAGQDKPTDQAGDAWADEASHLGAGQDPDARDWLAKDDPSTARDLRGGWYDAGDYNKYTPWHAGYLVTLLQTYRLHPHAVGDDLGIPESGNGRSDLLDEILWGLAWLERMQLDDGSVLCLQGLATASPPSAATGPSYYGPPTTHATQRSAAAFALAASVLDASPEAELRGRAAELADRAEAAWAWADKHRDVAWFNNDDSRTPGSAGLGAGQQEVDDLDRADSRVEAAVYLYGATAAAAARSVVESSWKRYLPTGTQSAWTVDKQETLLYYASLPGVPRATVTEIRDSYHSALTSGPSFLQAVDGQVDPYRAPLSEYTWGSNGAKSQLGRMFALARDYGFAGLVERADSAARDYLHYLHGVNPLGLVYLTNMASAGAEHSAATLYHQWFADGTQWDEVGPASPGPVPGLLVGGPNPYFSTAQCCIGQDGCSGAADESCERSWRPPLDQPPMKSYRQFNADWPANSWEVTENSNGYQVAYLRLLVAVIDPREA